MWNRLQSAREAGNPVTYTEDNAARSGREAEDQVSAQLASSRAFFGELRVWHALRVPAGAGRREIDHVVLNSGGLHILEVKRWSGTVSVDANGDWVQVRPHGAPVRHGDVRAKHDAKVTALLDYLRAKGVSLPPSAVHQRVLLTGRSCAISPEIGRMGCVLCCEGVSAYLSSFEQSALSNLAARVLPSTLTGRKLDPAQMATLCVALDGLGTWDSLTLNGGRVISGDARGFSCGGKPHVAYELPSLRRIVSEIIFEHRRSITVGSVLAVLGHEPATTLRPTLRTGAARASLPPPAPISIQAELTFQPAGQPRAENFRVNDIEKLVLSP